MTRRKVLLFPRAGFHVPRPYSIDVWMRWESDKLNTGIVTRPKSLEALLEDPTVETKDGELLQLDRQTLGRLDAVCTPAERGRLRLPITVHFTADVGDSAYVIDELAADVLHRLEGWGAAYAYRDGRMWLPHSLAVDLLLRYGGALQRMMF